MTLRVVQKHYLGDTLSYYGGGILSGGYAMERFSDVATEICIRHDRNEGMLASYSSVQFSAPLYAGDLIEVEGVLARAGSRSREISFTLRVIARRIRQDGARSQVLDEPIVAATAWATVVVPSGEK